jgi:hypothetical protein
MIQIDDIPDHKATGLIVQRVGEHIVITDPNGKQFAVTNPDELWEDLLTILSDATLPKMLTGAVGQPGASSGGEPQEFFDAFCSQAAGAIGDAYGPLFGRIAEAAARRGAPAGLSLLKKISRTSKKGAIR